MEAAVRVFADRLQQGSEPSSVEQVYDDERSEAVRRERSLSLQARTAWEFLYVRMAHRQFATVIVTAGDVADDIRVDAASGRRSLNELLKLGLIARKEYDRHSGAWTIEIVDPFKLGIGRATRGGHEQAELEFGSCSLAPAEGSTEAGARTVAIATDAIERPPSQPAAEAPGEERPPPRGTSVDRSVDTSAAPQQSNLSKSSAQLEPSNFSNLSEAPKTSLRRERLEVREVARDGTSERGTSVDTSAEASGEPKKLGSAMAGVIDRLMPTAADRAREIDGVVKFIRDVVGQDVRSDRPLIAIAEAVCDRTFPQARLVAVCATYRDKKRDRAIRCEPGWYFLCAVEKSAWQIGLPLKLTNRQPPRKPR